MTRTSAARLRVLACAVLFSTGGAAIKGVHMTGWQVACFRSGIAAIAILLMAPAAWRALSRKAALVGVAYATTLIFFVQANKLTTAAQTIYLQSAAPLYMLLLSPWLLKERIRTRDLVFMAALAVGMGMLFLDASGPTRTAPRPVLGNLLATVSGVGWALTVIGIRWLARSEKEGEATAVAATVAGNGIAFFACLPFALPVQGAGVTDWGLLLFLGIVQIGLAYILLTGGMRSIPALEGALLLLVEPVLSPLWAWIFQGEMAGPWVFAGAATIFLATILHTIHTARKAAD